MNYLLNFFTSSLEQQLITISGYLGFLGGIILMCALIPPLLQVSKQKQTFGLNSKLLSFSMFTGSIFCLVGLIICINNANYLLGSAMIISNVSSACVNGYLAYMKQKNVKKAHEHGLSEMDYYYHFVKPTINVDLQNEKNVAQENLDTVEVLPENKIVNDEINTQTKTKPKAKTKVN